MLRRQNSLLKSTSVFPCL
uniref:Uncharacterized protein n=1 Tax=Rhizophora mucronata TaxID=61149 RepID=A0A2P2NRP9_RHIMU